MKDKLERFIRDNREDFDIVEPRADLWKELEKGLGHSQHRFWLHLPWSNRMTWQLAASLLLVIGLGGFWYFAKYHTITDQPEVAVVSPVYTKEFTQYTQLIDTKRMELKTLTESNPSLYQQFASDLDRLEKTYQHLRSELPKTPNHEILIQAMIENLETQLNLLNQQLQVIQRIKQQSYDTTKEPV